MNIIRKVSLNAAGVMLGAILVACSPANDSDPAAGKVEQGKPASAIMLMYVNTEPEVDPYQTRIIINDSYVRFDDGRASNDFVLFDRQSGVIYSSSAETRRILVINPKTSKKPELNIKITDKSNDDPNAPVIGGQKMQGWSMSANGEICSQVMVVPGMLPGANAALREYTHYLSLEHADALHKIPLDMQNSCDIAINILAHDWALTKGLPAREQHYTGFTRSLLDYNDGYEADPALFELPKEYQRFSREDMSAG